MSGQNNSDDDFLDDDFVVEGLADLGPRDDLGLLFTPADQPQPAAPPAAAVPDAEDDLFTDHTANLTPSEVFVGKQQFDEKAASTWNGANLDLDDEFASPTPAAAGQPANPATEWGEAEAFADDGASIDAELEIVGEQGAVPTPVAGGTDFTVVGVVTDELPTLEPVAEGEDLPLLVPITTVGADEGVEAAAVEESAAGIADAEAVDSTTFADAAAAPGQETVSGSAPLADTPTADAEDALFASLDGLAPTSESVEGEEFAEGEPVAEGEFVEGEEYAEGEPVGAGLAAESAAPVLAGPGNRSYRLATAFFGLAASCAVIAGAGLVVLRPELVGLDLGPARVAQVRIERPALPTVVSAPKPVNDMLVQVPSVPTQVQPQRGPKPTPTPGAKSGAVAKLFGALARLGGKRPGGPSQTPTKTTPTDTAPPVVVPVSTQPVAMGPTPAPSTTPPPPRSSTGEEAWPVRPRSNPSKAPARNAGGTLVRIGDDTMVGDATPDAMVRQAVEGVMPGLRAFALLRNGNFFVGRVKMVDAAALTLRTSEGEVSLQREELVRVVGLGTADYEALQRATEGFVRLTNSNKLIGGILSQVADDHVVMEWRSNRVILPRSVVGSVVQGQQPDDVQFKLSAEEDAWLRSLAERELGREREAALPKKPADVPPDAEPGK